MLEAAWPETPTLAGVFAEADSAASPAAHVGPATFRELVEQRNPTLLRYEHVPRLVEVCERVVRGELLRVIVILPPRYFKSELFSRLLPAYYLTRYPDRDVGLASYSAELAWKLSAKARENYRHAGAAVASDTSAKKLWGTGDGGEMWAAGLVGSITGSGFNLGIVDDPMKPRHTRSRAFVEAFREFWPDTWCSRMEPGAAMIVVMQRLGTEDPIDFLYRREIGEDTDEAPEHWHVVHCDEIKSSAPLERWDGPQGLPRTCTLEPDPRAEGEVLAPSRFSADEVAAAQRRAGTEVAGAQRQGRPAKAEGLYWREGWFLETYDVLPADAYDGGRDWDAAYTKDEHNSASAYVRSYRGPDLVDAAGKPIRNSFPIYVDEADWEWREFPQLIEWMKLLRGPHHIEAKASGKSAAQTLRSQGVPVSEVTVEGDKLKRANDVQGIVAEGRVRVRKSLLRRLLHGERQGLLRVRAETLIAGGPDLDLNDAFVQAITRHTGGARGGPRFRAL